MSAYDYAKKIQHGNAEHHGKRILGALGRVFHA
jgi:hypothetical protein